MTPTQPTLTGYSHTARDFNYARKLWSWFTAPPPEDSPSEFAVKEIRFDYSRELRGPFDFTGRHYLRRPIDDAARPEVRKQTKVFGRGNGKTSCDEVQICYKLKYQPGTRGLSAWPSTQGEGSSEDFAGNRLGKTIKATPTLAQLVPPGGQERYVLNKKKIAINGSHYGFIGAHSGGKGVGNRLTDIYFDEIEKYPPTLKNEGSVINLAEGSVEGVTDYQIHYSSTPVLEDGLIWKQIQKSNLHLRFMPCPHCQRDAGLDQLKTEEEHALRAVADRFRGWFVILFSADYSAGWPTKMQSADPALHDLPIPAATVKFRYPEGSEKMATGGTPGDAKLRDGSWNVHQAARNARIECPHCKKAIRDTEVMEDGSLKIVPLRKQWMDEHGAWICVKPGEPGHIGYMINSLYAPVINDESTWGGRVQKFLAAIEEGSEAVKTFVNAILAGVYLAQDSGMNKVEMSTTSAAKDDWVPMLTADFQKNWPYLWFVVRKWCAFKLLPPFGITDGRPDFVPMLDEPGNETARETCGKLLGLADPSLVTRHSSPVWFVIAELMRFDSRTGQSPIIDFLLAQKITGQKLVKLYRDDAGSNTQDFRRLIYKLMGEARPPVGGDSELVAAGHCALSGEYIWDEFRDVIKQFHVGKGMPVPNHCVAIDCGYAEQFDREVLRKCCESATEWKFYDPTSKNRPAVFYQRPIHNFCLPVPRDSWLPVKGYPMNQRWNHGGIRNELNLNIDDPYFGTQAAGERMIEILELPSGLFWLRKNDLRSPRTKQVYSVAQNVEFFPKIHTPDGTPTAESNFRLEDYQKQLNEQYYDEAKGKVEPRHGRGGSQARAHPYHLDDCETYQVALATHHGFFETEQRVAAPHK